MGRLRRIAQDAKPTTISLTSRQQIAFQKLQIKRQEEGHAKPTLTEVMVEGFQVVLKREGASDAELERTFPKQVQQKATIQVITKRRKG
jgi:hypothetical protein